MNKILTLPLLLIFFVLFPSCNQPEFAPPAVNVEQKSEAIKYYNYSYCSNFSLIKPPVDFLFLWDQSSSQNYVAPQVKKALSEMILRISDNFDYRIVIAGLVKPKSSSDTMYVITSNRDGISVPDNMIKGPTEAINALSSLPLAEGNYEAGISRARDLITSNIANGVFRMYGNTIVVLMSNEDDNSYALNKVPTLKDMNDYLSNMKTQYDYLKSVQLRSTQFRFLSMVAHSNCTAGLVGSAYKKFSEMVHGTSSDFRTQAGLPADSYNICTNDFLKLFDEIEMVIQAQTVPHDYNFWPIAESLPSSFDPTKIVARKSEGSFRGEPLVQGDRQNGFEYRGFLTNQMTRYAPTSGEPFTGHMIELFGNARVRYPQCLLIEIQSLPSYYGYIQLHTQPVIESIKLRINGQEIPQSTTNGWSYIGFRQSQNVKVRDPQHPNEPGVPEDYRTGYFIKLTGGAIFTNSATIQLNYQGASE